MIAWRIGQLAVLAVVLTAATGRADIIYTTTYNFQNFNLLQQTGPLQLTSASGHVLDFNAANNTPLNGSMLAVGGFTATLKGNNPDSIMVDPDVMVKLAFTDGSPNLTFALDDFFVGPSAGNQNFVGTLDPSGPSNPATGVPDGITAIKADFFTSALMLQGQSGDNTVILSNPTFVLDQSRVDIDGTATGQFTVTVASSSAPELPEPSSWLLMGLGALAAGAWRRLRRRG